MVENVLKQGLEKTEKRTLKYKLVLKTIYILEIMCILVDNHLRLNQTAF